MKLQPLTLPSRLSLSCCLVCVRFAVLSSLLLVVSVSARAIETEPGEMRTMRQWLDAHLLKCKLSPGRSEAKIEVLPPMPPQPGLEVLANNDAVTQNGRGTSPLKIGTREFTRGLYCHAVSKVVVHLPGPAGVSMWWWAWITTKTPRMGKGA